MPAHDSSLPPAGEADDHELELELRRVRSKAEAARFDAQAAEIELLLRKSARQTVPLRPAEPFDQLAVNSWQELLAAAAALPPSDGSTATPTATPSTPPPEPAAESHTLTPPGGPQQMALASAPSRSRRVQRRAGPGTAGPPSATREPSGTARESRTAAHQARASQTVASQTAATPTRARRADSGRASAATPPGAQAAGDVRSAENARVADRQTARGRAARRAIPSPDLGARLAGDSPNPRRRKRPAAWIVSSVAHAAVLLLLAGMTISVAEPVNRITLDAAPPQSTEETLETVVFEQSEQPEEEPSRLSAVSEITELSPLGPILGSEIAIEAPEIRTPSPSPLEMLPPGLAAESLRSASPSTTATSEFFGARGGGNHFVYLVDNSGSMATIARNGFDVARQEVLKSVDALTDEQRFYVIFFGEEVLRMRLRDPTTPEPRSVYATQENKAALRRWAMGITMQPGRWPEKALEFAFELRPDAIFLLTDGEMSQRAEPMIRQHNLVENLFEGPRPRSIIHTIGFYSRDGAEQMQTIARVNGGSYHFIPPPPK